MLLAAALLIPAPAWAQDGGQPPGGGARPVIGLVLSGGGAGGLAHVGVLQWLEERHVPVDLVAGTSMGGLVGGIYASGADVDEMLALLEAMDWPLILSAEPPYALRAFRRKEDAREAPATFELGLRNGFALPPGINAGHQVGLFLDRIAFPYSRLESFDDLPTAFACVAVDLESGQQVVFRDGRLADALRATMSYPGWFAPVHAGDKVLVDGAVLNNLPTDVALSMGADVVIAVDLGLAASEQEPSDTVLGVLNRTLSVMTRDNAERNAAAADVLVTPDVSQFGFVDFDRAAGLVRIGYQAAEAVAGSLSAYSLDDASWAAYVEARRARRRVFEATPQFLVVRGAGPIDAATVEAALDHHVGVALDPRHLDGDLTRIVGWGRYNVAGYREAFDGERAGLEIDVQAKAYGPPFVRPILDLRGSRFGDARITFGGRFTFYDVAGVNSEWRSDLTYGQQTRAATEVFVPIHHSGFFLAPHLFAAQSAQFLYEAGERVAELQIEHAGGGADAGYVFGPRSELRLGFGLEYQRAHVKVGDPLLDPIEGTAADVHVRWRFDGANSPLVPTAGARIEAAVTRFSNSPEAPSAFYRATFDLLGAHRLGGRFSLFGALRGGTSFAATAPPLHQFLLGGPLRLGALGTDELRGSHYYFGQAGVLWALGDENRLAFFGKFYLAAFYELGDAFEDMTRPLHDATVGLIGETLLGAVFGGGAVGQDGRRAFFFAVGRLF